MKLPFQLSMFLSIFLIVIISTTISIVVFLQLSLEVNVKSQDSFIMNDRVYKCKSVELESFLK